MPLVRALSVQPAAARPGEAATEAARALTPILARYFQRPATITLRSSDIGEVGSWIDAANDAAVPATLLAGPGDTMLFAEVDAPLAGAIADCFFGGGSVRTARRGAPGRGERSLIDRMLTRFAVVLDPGAPDVPLTRTWVCGSRAPCPVARDVMVETLVLDVAIDGRAAGSLRLARALAEAPTEAPQRRHAPGVWRRAIARALGEMRLPTRAVLARPGMSLGALARLRRGDTIPIGIPAKVPLVIGTRRFARGTIGECNGTAAFQIETLEQETLA
jgi:flagellar motor switch protein FliM